MPEFDERSGGEWRIMATFARYEGRGDICILHPADPPDEKQLTAWITAEQGSYVPVAEWR